VRAAVVLSLSSFTLFFFPSGLAAQACHLFVFFLLFPVLPLAPDRFFV